jgi:hypothetical protein
MTKCNTSQGKQTEAKTIDLQTKTHFINIS